MKFNKFYNSLDDEQRKEFNKYIKTHVNEQKRSAMIARGFSWFLICILVLNMYRNVGIVLPDKIK